MKVLWFDDEHERLETIKDQAIMHDILLIGVTNAEDGISELEKNIKDYDAVIVDGKFYLNAKQSGDAVDDSALSKVARTLDTLTYKKKIPWFILSGQPSFTKEDNPIAKLFDNKKVFDKSKDEDFEELWAEITKQVDLQMDTQIRHKYQRAFNVCTDKYIGSSAGQTLLDVLKLFENDSNIIGTEDLFNPIRKIIEKLFASFYRIGILPGTVYKQPGWLNNSSKFLAGSHSSYKLKRDILHPTIASLLKNILQIIQDASHCEGDLKLKVDQYVKEMQTPYLYKSVVFQLLDVLIWFKKFADENPDHKKNESYWITIEKSEESIFDNWIRGIIKSVSDSGYGTFKPNGDGRFLSIPPHLINEHNLKVNEIIELTTKPDPKNTKILIDKIRKLDI